jgi:hypothetical protein
MRRFAASVAAVALLSFVRRAAGAADPGDTAYGRWAPDVHGNPSYVFTGGASDAPDALFPTSATPLHAAGNDRVSAIVFSDGTASLRQDEGGAKLLHGFAAAPRDYQFRGAAGYVSGAGGVLGATAVDASAGVPPASPLEITLGMGYATKAAPLRGGGGVRHTLLAPFGDASVVLSLVELEPGSPEGAVWTEAWAAGARWEMGWGADAARGVNASAFQAPWAHNFSAVHDAAGALIGLADGAFIVGAARGGGGGGGGGGGAPRPASLHDPSPRPSFFVCLTCGAGGLRSLTTNGAQVFCADGAACGDASAGAPLARGAAALLRGFDNATADFGAASVLALQARFPPGAGGGGGGGGGALAFLVGYLTAEDEAACGGAGAPLAACVRAKAAAWAPRAAGEGARTAAAWAAGANDLAFGRGAARGGGALAARARAAQEPASAPPAPRGAPQRWASWEGREAAWHSYALRAGLSFDDWAGDFTLNQGGNYLYVSGYNAAARDPLAHVMPLAWGGRSAERFVVGVLNATLLSQKRAARDAEGRPAGSLVWGLAAFGAPAAGPFNASDLELAALFALAQFALATRGALPPPLWEAAWASFQHLDAVIGVGAHGLIRLLESDHNDGLYGGLGVALTPFSMEHAESVMNSALGAYVLPQFADALEAAGGVANASARAAAARGKAAALAAAVGAQFVANGSAAAGGGWYRRAWLGGGGGPGTGWRGSPDTDGVLWTETQSWALLAGVPGGVPGRAEALVAQLDRAARAPSPIGAINTAPDATTDGGVGYGGVWACGCTALVAALGTRGFPDLALAEWRKASLAGHAAAYPHIWFGATAGADVYNSAWAARHNATPGSTRCHWGDAREGGACNELAVPVLNSWAHTLGAFPLPALVGAEWGAAGLTVRPPAFAAPGDGEYTVFTPLVSASRGGGGGACALAGHWAPALPAGARVRVRVQLAPADAARCTRLSVNGGPPAPAPIAGGVVTVDAQLAGEPALLTWELS